jgi:NADH-quinone oxidoreductase subunit M
MAAVGFPLLSLVLWLPTLGALGMLLLPRERIGAARGAALGVSLLTFLISLLLVAGFDSTRAVAAGEGLALQFREEFPWVSEWGISYLIGVDGVSLWLVMLTTFLMPLTILSTWDSTDSRARDFLICLLLLETAMLGVFLAGDLFMFYLFWEFSLIPMALLIGVWGGPRRIYAAVKFFLYTFAGSVFMLAAIIALYLLHGGQTFSLPQIVADIRAGTLALDATTQRLLFLGFFIAFAIKVPLWPLHTWLPTAHVEAPTAGSVILAGVLLKLGTYGFIRYNLTLFPEASAYFAPAIALLATVGVLYGAVVAYFQSDVKKIVAYSSVSHLGFVMLGIFALNQLGIQGAILQSVNHGLSTGALFLLVGMLYERMHTRDINRYSGVWKAMPVFSALSLVIVLSSVGLPGLNGFVGEFTIMQGAFSSPYVGAAFVLPSVVGVVLASTYLLRMWRGVFMGEVTSEEQTALKPITRREVGLLAALLVPIVVLGLFPNLVFVPMQESVADVVNAVTPVLAAR